EPVAVGPLDFGFTPHQGRNHFGPELQFGHVLGDALEEPVLLVKTAWGGKSLFRDFRPPSSGGTVGPYYRRMIEDVRSAVARAVEEIPAAKGRRIEIAGLVWYQGWNDGCEPEVAIPQYAENLANLIRDVRRDLGVADLPVVVGELTGSWVDAPKEWKALREAQAAAARREEWAGRVLFVPTAAFVRKPEDSPHPTHEHHEFGNAETYMLVGDAFGRAMRSLVVKGAPAFEPTLPAAPGKVSNGELSGYMLVPVEKAPKEFNAGFSLYAAAWPIVEQYPGSRFQTGLFGTWMFAQFEGEAPKKLYSDIEGGLGWWRDTRFATSTPKFIMGGVAPNFSSWANGPGAGKGRDWNQPLGKYAIAQLSPWVVWPPDGLNLAQGTCGELFGYGYLPLPLIDAKAKTAGADVPTGDQCWTLFLNTANFKGPLCFFTPYFWSASAAEQPELAGKLLDSRPSEPNKAFQMETQWVPARVSTLPASGNLPRTYARTAPMSFPIDADGRTVVLHRLTVYGRDALTEPVRRWFAGGPPASGMIDTAASHVKQFHKGGGSTWRIGTDETRDEKKRETDWSVFGTPTAHDPMTFGYQWNTTLVRPVDEKNARRVRLPEYYRLDEAEGKPPRWVAVAASDVPPATGLHKQRFETPKEKGEGAYVTPEDPASPFRAPGPVAGPFEVTLGDGSTVTYAWYRFADQPAMLNADLSIAEREAAQRRVEMLHRAWTKDRQYLPPPTTGSLASIDPALIVTPPPGFEIGYVPIALRQERKRGGR
ncbi:MAG: sialate O-acetylesterase, partial [Phycisphaerales bacterium]